MWCLGSRSDPRRHRRSTTLMVNVPILEKCGTENDWRTSDTDWSRRQQKRSPTTNYLLTTGNPKRRKKKSTFLWTTTLKSTLLVFWLALVAIPWKRWRLSRELRSPFEERVLWKRVKAVQTSVIRAVWMMIYIVWLSLMTKARSKRQSSW